MTNDIKGVGYAAPCDGCGEEAILGDELFFYDLPVGMSALCLDCGPEENYADLDISDLL